MNALRRLRSLAALLLLSMLAGAAHAQSNKRCDLEGKDTTTSGNVHFRKCLDLSALDNQSITVPSNVSRIDNDGLSLCTSSDSTGGLVDLAYVYDNSGSMNVTLAFISGSGDTTFYEKGTNCNSTTTSGTVTIDQWNNTGTVTAQKSIPKLVSNAGCTEIAGDAYNFRGKAYRDAITNQHNRSPQSSAGIMSFTDVVANVQDPLVLSNANLPTVLSHINAVSHGGTDYGPPLDTAKRWLTTPITKNPKKAIIFLSDGKPNNTNYLPNVDGSMPPIYGIYVGKANADTARLFQLSQLTNGSFFVIPPNHPDSLVRVVDRILNILLRRFNPDSASVTNTDIAPVQTAFSKIPSGFQKQADSSYLMLLNDVIGLKPNAANAITVFTKFVDQNTNAVDTRTIHFTINTTAPPANTTQNITGTSFGFTCYDRSSLRIVSVANPPNELALLTDTSTGYRVRLRTSPTTLNSATAAASSKVGGDAESPSVPRLSSSSDSAVFLQATGSPAAFKVVSAAPSIPGTLEARLYDTVIVSWTHPRDAQDFSADTVIVQSKNIGATAYFAAVDNGPKITQYRKDQQTVFVVIHDQPKAPGLSYKATIVSGDLSDPFSQRDTETVILTEVSGQPGVFTGQIRATYDPKTTRDAVLQVSQGGDQLVVTYVDPLYGEKVTGNAGFDEGRQLDASLYFTDANGRRLDSNETWSPANSKLYMSYNDDFYYGNIPTKKITLLLTSKKYGAAIGTDHEAFNIDLLLSSTDSNATWSGSIDLLDFFPPADSNGKAETSFRGEVTIQAFSHDNIGHEQLNKPVRDSMVIAFPDSAAAIDWKLADTSNVPKGTDGLIITVKDQDFTKANNDSVLVGVRCENSVDSVSGFYAKETSPGTYTTGILVEDNGTPNTSDKILSCRTAETVIITYIDPVYGTTTQLAVHEVEKPIATATPAGNAISISSSVVLSDNTPGAVIYYTLDGSTPIPGVSKQYVNGEKIVVFSDTTIKAIAVLPDWKPSKVMTEVYTKQRTASTLVLLDEHDNDIHDINSDVKIFHVRVTTTQGNLFEVRPAIITKVGKDAEASPLGGLLPSGDHLVYSDAFSLEYGKTAVKGNDTLEANGIDTLIAVWTNPYDPTDVAKDTLIIKPAQGTTVVEFTDQAGNVVTTYPQTADSIYIRVKSRPQDPTFVKVTTGLGDAENLTLTQVSPGVFTAKAAVGKDGLKHAGSVDVAVGGDQLSAVFTDPIYGTPTYGSAGFNAQVQETAHLEFIDKDGNLVPPDAIWSPKEGKIFLQYTDDWNAGIDSKVHTDTAHLVLINRKSGTEISRDNEVVVLTLDTSTSTRGVWKGSLTLLDQAPPISADGKLETNYRGELTATVTPHNNTGDPTPPAVQAKLVIAYPNQVPEIIIRDTSGGVVTRPTRAVDIIIKDQPVSTTGNPTITATVACLRSNDQVVNVVLVWNGKDAYEIQPPLDKEEGNTGNPSDTRLTCQSSDVIRVTYVDPVYGDTRINEVTWIDERAARIYFTSTRDNSVITSVSEATDTTFNVIVEGNSDRRDVNDTIKVVLNTSGNPGDLDTAYAVETGPLTGIYVATVRFGFSSSNPVPNNHRIEGKINQGDRVNRVVLTATATVNSAPISSDLALFSSYDLVAKAYVKDENGDGRADHVYFVFDHKVSRLPSGLDDVIWNDTSVSADHKKATSAMLSFKAGDSSIIVADFSGSQFDLAVTGPGNHPYARFPDDNLFGGQRSAISDSMGPVITNAEKRPSNMGSYDYNATEKRFNPDTLIIAVSEPIKSSGTFAEMLMYTKGCSDNGVPRQLKTYSEPTQLDSLTWQVIVDNSPNGESPLVGDCVFLQTDGRYTDIPGNVPPLLGFELHGQNPQEVIRVMRGYPPVAGLDGVDNGFVLANNDLRNGKDGTWSHQSSNGNSWDVPWIAPAGYVDGDPDFMKHVEDMTPSSNSAGAITDRNPEVRSITTLSSDVASIQVISTGPYRAYITIFDHLGNFVRSSTQGFGYHGEYKNAVRAVPGLAQGKGLVSWLVWDMKDENHTRVGQGVYIWKVNFTFFSTKPGEEPDKKSEVMYTRTGVLRKH